MKVPAAALTILLISSTALAIPADPVYSDDSSRIFWFLVLSDQHITARDSDGEERLAWLLSDCLNIVEPEIIFNMGDLTDASKGEPLVSVYPGQQDEEWELYQSILDNSGITVDRYIDLPGNHDQYNEKGLDHYLLHSLAGRTWNRTQHSVVIEKPWGRYHFLGIDTAGNDGAIFPLDNAGLDLGELMYIQGALQDNDDARLTLMFGHHPIVRPDLGFKLGEGSDEIQDLMGDFFVRTYFYGHTHEYRDLYWPDNERMPITLHENVDSFGKADENQLMLVSIDNDNLHIRQVTVHEWPWVIVTTPSDVRQGGGNPWAVDVPAGLEKAPVRALGFTADPFLSCEHRLDDGGWHPMTPTGNHVHEGFMDTRGMQPGLHTVEVRCMPGPSTGHKVTFQVSAYTCGNGVDEDQDGLTDWPDDPGCDSVYDSDEFNEPVVVEEFVEETAEPVRDVIEPDTVDALEPGDESTVADIDDTGTDEGTAELPPVDDTAADLATRPDSHTGGDTGTNELAAGDTADNDEGGSGNDTDEGGGCTAGASGDARAALVLMAALAIALFAARRPGRNPK